MENHSSGKQFSDNVIEYTNQVEEILTWLFQKQEELEQRPDELSFQNAPLNLILEEYSSHEKYMTEISEYCHTIMKCKEEGQEMRDDENLTDEDRDEVGIHLDLMMVRYEKLKIITTDRLKNLQRIIEERQRSKIERLEAELTSMESKMAGSNNIGPDYDAIKRQIRDIEGLKYELSQKQDLLNFISEFVIFDEVDATSLQFNIHSGENIERRLESMNQRWTNICRSVDDRNNKLKKAEYMWRLLYEEGPHFSNWLKNIENSLKELSEAARNISDPQTEKAFISKLMKRSEKIDLEIKSKQSFYTSLESRVRVEIEKFDDPCSMLVIELEKKLEDMQDYWNLIMRQKRMLDYTWTQFQTESIGGIIPLPDPITTSSNNDLCFNSSSDNNGNNTLNASATMSSLDRDKRYNGILNDSISTRNDESSLNLNGSLSDPVPALDNSLSSEPRSLMYGSNQDQPSYATNSHEDLSSPINLASPHNTGDMFNNNDQLDAGNEQVLHATMGKCPDIELNLDDNKYNHSDGSHSCRVEEWKYSLESFMHWLKQVETWLGIDPETNGKSHGSWNQIDTKSQIALVKEIEDRIRSTCQDEFDCLLLQGQQIIEDLIPEIGENEYETNMKDILADIEIRYGAVKQCLFDRKAELADKEKWRSLLLDMKESVECIIQRMADVIPEDNIGVDLISLAQQQDQLIHLKEDLMNDEVINANMAAAKEFISLCDNLQHQYGQQFHGGPPTTVDDIFLSFKEFREPIEDQLDKLTLHYSELSQLIDDRLERLDEVHKEMHALQHRVQELAAKLQVAEILKSDWVPLENLSIEQLSQQLEDLKLYRERLCEVESIHKDMNSIYDWMIRTNVPLSQSNLKRLTELNTIWDSIQMMVEERQKQIELAFDEQSGSEQKFLAQTVADLPKWERKVATSKVPYFIDHETGKTQWDHPKFTNLLNEMTDLKEYVFSVYRTAMKLRVVQRKLGVDMLMLEQLKDLFISLIDIPANLVTKQQNNYLTDNQSVQTSSMSNYDAPIGIEQIIFLLKAIYERIQIEELPDLDVPLAIDLTLNWLLNLYDSTRTGYISALSLKVGLSLLCCATREEKYMFMYELVANPATNSVDARKLGTLFENCMRIPIYLGESESFGGSDLIETSIRNCFSMSKFNPHHPNCISLSDYLNWLRTEPQFIIWLPVLHRILISETTTHQVKCRLCGADPIKGLRYRCLKCFKFNICQNCFLTGRHVYEHHDPIRHPMQEYCSKTSSGERVRDFTKILRNKLNPRAPT